MEEFETQNRKAKRDIIACVNELSNVIEEIAKESNKSNREAIIDYCYAILGDINKLTESINED